jgi:hypothetical protein
MLNSKQKGAQTKFALPFLLRDIESKSNSASAYLAATFCSKRAIFFLKWLVPFPK